MTTGSHGTRVIANTVICARWRQWWHAWRDASRHDVATRRNAPCVRCIPFILHVRIFLLRRSYVRNDASIRATWLFHVIFMTSVCVLTSVCVCEDSWVTVCACYDACAIAHTVSTLSSARRDAVTVMTRFKFLHMCVVTHSFVCHDAFVWVLRR